MQKGGVFGNSLFNAHNSITILATFKIQVQKLHEENKEHSTTGFVMARFNGIALI